MCVFFIFQKKKITLISGSLPDIRVFAFFAKNNLYTEAEETELIKHKSQYQIYLYLLFRQYVTVYPSIPHELIGKKNYHDHNYYQSVLVKKNQSALYSIAWRRNRNKLFLDSSESFNGSDSLMVMAAKKEIFELFPYDTK